MTRAQKIIAAGLFSATLVGGATAAASASDTPASAEQDAKQRPGSVSLEMKTSTPALAACFPDAWAVVKVYRTADAKGFDTVSIRAKDLRPNTQFTLFFLEKARAPFGAAEYFGDFTTDAHGRGNGTYRLIAEEAFAFDNVTQVRKNLDSVGFWFADPKDDDQCVGVTKPTGFDGDGEAGVQMMNSGDAKLP